MPSLKTLYVKIVRVYCGYLIFTFYTKHSFEIHNNIHIAVYNIIIKQKSLQYKQTIQIECIWTILFLIGEHFKINWWHYQIKLFHTYPEISLNHNNFDKLLHIYNSNMVDNTSCCNKQNTTP